MPIEERIRRIISGITGIPVEKISAEMNLEDLGIDDLSKTEIGLDLEEAFYMAISNQDYDKLITVQDIYDLVNKDMDKMNA